MRKKERRKNFPLRLSATEREALSAKAEAAGLTLSAYLREAGLKKQISKRKKLVPEVNRLTYLELGKIGHNINQLTKAAHIAFKKGWPSNLDLEELRVLKAMLQQIQQEVYPAENDSQTDQRQKL